MHVAIYSIQSIVFDGDAEKLIAKTPLGEITVLDDHLPIISSLVGPTIRVIEKDGAEKIVELPSGFLEVQPNSRAVILVNPL